MLNKRVFSLFDEFHSGPKRATRGAGSGVASAAFVTVTFAEQAQFEV
jgi:hypothetical protein